MALTPSRLNRHQGRVWESPIGSQTRSQVHVRPRPEQRCVVCNSLLRPYKAKKADWPGTKAKVSSRPLLCTAHQNGKSTATIDFKENVVARLPQQEVRIVKRLIRERFEGDDYLLITDALGIGSDID